MFFSRCVVRLGQLLPWRWRFTRWLLLILNHGACRRKLVAWHYAQLEALDSKFRLQNDIVKLTGACEKARSEGIGPSDPRYPSLLDTIDWKEEARVASINLARYMETSDEHMKKHDEALREYPQERADAVTKAGINALKRNGDEGRSRHRADE